MSTRGLVIIRSNNEIKVAQYNHHDSYISYLGEHIQEIISKLINDKELFDKFKENVNNSTFHNEEEREEIDAVAILDGLFEYPALTFDSGDFISDTLFCEYAYIIDLDIEILEIHKKGKIFKMTFLALSKMNLEDEFNKWYEENFKM